MLGCLVKIQNSSALEQWLRRLCHRPSVVVLRHFRSIALLFPRGEIRRALHEVVMSVFCFFKVRGSVCIRATSLFHLNAVEFLQ